MNEQEPGDRPVATPDQIDALAVALYAALKEDDPHGVVRSKPTDEEPGIIDGCFNLRRVAERVLHALSAAPNLRQRN